MKLDNPVSIGGVPFEVWFIEASPDNEYGRQQSHATTLSFRYAQEGASEAACDEHFQTVLEVVSDHETYAMIKEYESGIGSLGAIVIIEPEDAQRSIRAKVKRDMEAPAPYETRSATLKLDGAIGLSMWSRLDRAGNTGCKLIVEFRRKLQNSDTRT